MTLADLAELVPCDNSTVSRIEAGLVSPDLHFAETCDTAFPDRHGWFTRFWHDSQDWDANGAFPAAFRDFAEDEQEATSLLVYESSVLPGLLQAEGYARAVLSRHPGVSESLVGERVRARLARQGVLDSGVALWALIDELVLSREIGGPEVFRDALAHLARMARRPNVTVQIIPKGDYHVGLQGSVNIAEKSGALPSAFIEEFTDGRTVDDPATLNAVITRYRHLQALALPASSSLEIIDKAAQQHD